MRLGYVVTKNVMNEMCNNQFHIVLLHLVIISQSDERYML
jgi:hypothetical protein